MPDGEPQFRLTKDHEKIEIEKFVTHRSWRRYVVHLEGPRWEVKAGCSQGEWPDLGHVPLLEFVGRMLQGFWAKPGLVNSKEKEQGFGRLCEGFI